MTDSHDRHVRRSGVHALLGTHQDRQLGAQAKDGEGPPPADPDRHESLVRGAPPRVGCRAASDVGVEAAWALCLLRDYGERLEPGDVQLSRRPHLAEVAPPSVAEEIDAVEAVPPPPRAIPSPANDGHPLGRARVAKPSVEEPDAEGSSRQGCNPAGASPAVSIAQVGHVAMPHPGMGNHPGDAWCKRPGRPARRCCGGCNLGC